MAMGDVQASFRDVNVGAGPATSASGTITVGTGAKSGSVINLNPQSAFEKWVPWGIAALLGLGWMWKGRKRGKR